MQATLAPVADSQRLPALDTARGFALLGILMVNIQSFGEPFGEFIAFRPEGEQGWPAWCAFYFVKIFCEAKFFTLFSTLFGMGLAIQLGRSVAKGQSFAGLASRRIAALGLIGFLHGTLLWYGDILFTYAISAIPFAFMVRAKARTLLIIAACLMFASMVLSAGFGAFMVYGDGQKQAAAEAAQRVEATASETTSDGTTATSENVAVSPFERLWKGWQKGEGHDPASALWRSVEVECYKHGPTRDAILMRTLEWLMIVLVMTVSGGYFWIIAMFAIGAALFKLGIFEPHRRHWLKRIMIVGWGVGIPIAVLYAFFAVSTGSIAVGVLAGFLNVPASSAVALGTLAAISLLATGDTTARFMKPFANIGRLGLSNYLLQTVICTTIFYYWGFGLFDSLTRIERIGVVIVVYVVQLILSAVWLQLFRIGPMEWLWRTFTYFKPQSFMRGD